MANDVPMFDDIPAFDDLPDAASVQASGDVPMFDDIPAFDDLPEAEGAWTTAGREALHSAVPAAAGFVGMGAGAKLGAAAGAPLGPLGAAGGAIVGGIGGMVAGSMAAHVAQEGALNAAGIDDSEQRALNREANPKSAFAGQMAPALAGMSPVGVGGGLARQAAIRGTGAGVEAGFEAGQTYLQGEEQSPARLAMAAAAGAVLPAVNRAGAKLTGLGERAAARMVPGRPNQPANPDAAAAHADVGDPNAEVDVAGSALAEAPPPPAGATTGNPQSAPTRSERAYPKSDPFLRAFDIDQARAQGDTLTQGDIDPATRVAITDPNSPPVAPTNPPGWEAGSSATRGERPLPSVGKWAELPPGDNRADTPQAPMPPDAAALGTPEGPGAVRPGVPGFPKPGDPLAAGENDATRLPANMPEKARAAIEKSLGRQANKVAARNKKKTKARDLSDTTPLTREEQAGLDAVNAAYEAERGPFPSQEELHGHTRTEEPNLAPRGAGKPQLAVDNTMPALKGETPSANERLALKSKLQAERTKAPLVAEKPMPALKGETPINDSITEAQRKAGNYPKARAVDFGKPLKVETHAGDKRRGKAPTGEDWEVELPYDYGYFNKTLGADKDRIDFARPKDDAPEKGDKHFIIDQRNLAKGGFDEHKVFTYYKDEAAARAHYEAGFSDGKGGERLGAITEVTRPELVKFLAKHTKKRAASPFSKAGFETEQSARPGVAKPAKERVVVKDLVEKLKAAGKTEEVAKIEAMPDEQLAKAVEGKRLRKYGVGTGTSAGYPVEGLTTADGKPVTANTKKKAQERSAAVKSVKGWFEASTKAAKPDESDGALLDRLRKGAAHEAFDLYKPTHMPREHLWAREAKRVLAKPTPGNIKKFREAERMLKGSDEDVDNYRGGNRIEADIARSRRSGEDAVASAEAANVDASVNTVEDDLISVIDAKKRAAKFDVPHEEAEAMVEPKPIKSKADLPVKAAKKTIDVADSSLAKIDTKAIDTEVSAAAAKRRAEAAALVARKPKAAAGESEGAASKVRNIQVADPKEIERIMAAANKAAERGKKIDLEALPPERDPSDKPKGPKDLFDKFISDERGSVDIDAIARGVKASLKRHEPKSYIAKTSKVPHSEYVRSLSDDLHKVDLADTMHRTALRKAWRAVPESFNNTQTQEKVYLLREKGGLSALTPEEQAAYDTHLKDILKENDEFVAAIRAIDPDRVGPDVLNHMMRIAKNDGAPKFSHIQDPDDPTRPAGRAMSTTAVSAKTRKFVALERVSDGKRFVISPRDGGFTLWTRYKQQRVKDPKFAFKAGDPYKAGNVDYIMRDAYTPEIEKNALGDDKKPMRYYKNAMLSAYLANAQLGSMARHLVELHRISNTPEFKKLTTRNEGKAKDRGWEETKLPNFRGTYMDPHLRYVFDDYHQAGDLAPQALRRLSQQVTKLLFWTPVAHIANVGAHWFVGRGWDWVTPKGTRSLFLDGAKAIRSVIAQDETQQALAKEGAGLIYGSVLNRHFVDQVFRAVGEDMVRNKSKWGPIADKIGVTSKQLFDAIYDTSAKFMWASNDVFITQRVLELQRKGISMKQAIIEAERDIPNYRIPTTLITEGEWGRILQRAAADPAILAFGRYHYGVFNSFANILKDGLGKDSSLGDRLDAVGKMFAMGILAFIAYPLWDKAIQWITGNKDARAHRRGPNAVASHISDSLQGKADIMKAMRSTTTLPPLTSTAVETLLNRDFRGKQIVEPGDVRAGAQGDIKRGARAALQFGEHKLKGLVSPYSTLANADKKGLMPWSAIRDSLLDVKNPSPKGVRYEKMIPIHTDRSARSRFRQGGSGPIEKLYNRGAGYR